MIGFGCCRMSDEFVPGPYATSQLMWHILKKGWQSGSVIGLGLVLPIAAVRSRRSGTSVDLQRMLTLMGYSGASGLGAMSEYLKRHKSSNSGSLSCFAMQDSMRHDCGVQFHRCGGRSDVHEIGQGWH